MARHEELSVNELTLTNGTVAKEVVIKPAAVATEVAADSTHTLAITVGGVAYRIMLTNA